MVIPVEARKRAGIHQGDVVSVEPEADGRILLVRMERAGSKRKIRIVRRKGTHAVGSAGRPLTSAQVRALLVDFP